MKVLWSLAVVCAFTVGPVYAACTYPTAPEQLPNGSTATREEMMAGQKAVKQYDTDMNAYLACLKSEADSTLAKGADTLTPEQKLEVQRRETEQHNAAVAELEATAARFNEQVKVYKAREKSAS
jgi:hypothetical protein